MTYEEILSHLDEAISFCSSLGLESLVKKGRFSEYRRRIEHLLVLPGNWREGKVSPQQEAQFSKEGDAYVVALSDAYELSEIVPRLKDLDPETLKPKLRTVLKGPALPGREDANSNAARNALFELITAARFKDAGFQPRLGEHPDLQYNIKGTEMLIECKRPFSEAGIGNCAADAWRQLRRNLDQLQGQ